MTEEQRRIRSESAIRYWDKHRKPRLQKNGYFTITIGNKRRYLHRVIMEEHLGRPLEKNEHVHHINGNKRDNRLENLELIDGRTHRSLHAKSRGFGCERGRIPTNKTHADVIAKMVEMRKAGATIAEICLMTGKSRPTVSKYIRSAI